MTILFRIAFPEHGETLPAATITAPQLAALCDLLGSQAARLGFPLIPADGHAGGPPTLPFEARVSPLALATLARVFDHDPAAIAVLEEAQFRGRRLRIAPSSEGFAVMDVAATPDPGHAVDLAEPSARVLLETLGFAPQPAGAVEAEELRLRLAEPAVRARAETAGIAGHIVALERLVASAFADSAARLEWDLS